MMHIGKHISGSKFQMNNDFFSFLKNINSYKYHFSYINQYSFGEDGKRIPLQKWIVKRRDV